MAARHLIKQRILIEELRRKRRSDDAERFAEVFRRATIDPNPHQIEAAMFALSRLPQGGALLCDEVGLGKTIEAGLVISQLRAEGKNHILIIVPLALARQWQVELQDLFSLRATIVGADSAVSSVSKGIYIVGREFASSSKGRSWIEPRGPWDLIIVDEAHEMFATIHQRFSKANGTYVEDLSRGHARRAAAVKALMTNSPVLLLTATPLQNNLYELWGLVHYVDKDQRTLGKFNEFCSLFVTGEGGRTLMPNMEETLRRRLAMVSKRTLRRQAQPFMKHPFRARHVHTANFNPAKQEAELYAAVNEWLARETLSAYKRGHRNLMALQLRRRMASSIEALVSTLHGIRERMLLIKSTGRYPGKEEDLEIEDLSEEENTEQIDMLLLEEDIKQVESLQEMARQVLLASGAGAKKERLLEVIRQIQSRSYEGVVSDKVVIFTESVRTMESLLIFLEENGLRGQVTTFSGTNDGPIASRALASWHEEIGRFTNTASLDTGAITRGALIHEFKTRTKILIATEAGGKGLNLQFCNCLINYDLPWNPQRIEQRIGRVHRYGQLHDVVIINFINLSNEAEQRVYDLLEQKLNVFQAALDSSDSIINTPDIALNLEQRLNEMLNKCRTQQEIRAAFDKYNLDLDEEQKNFRDEKLIRVRNLMGELDSSVKARLVQLGEKLTPSISRSDQTLMEILRADAPVEVVGEHSGRTLLRWKDRLFHLGPPEPGEEFGEPLHLQHPEVVSVIDRCIQQTDGQVLEHESDSELIYQIYRVRLCGIEEEERIMLIGRSRPDFIDNVDWFEDLETGISQLKSETERHQKEHITRLLAQIKASREDLILCGERRLAELEKKLEDSERKRRLAVSASESAASRAQQTKLKQALADVKEEIKEQSKIREEQLAKEEERIRRLKFVEATPTLLFTIKSVAPSGRTLA